MALVCTGAPQFVVSSNHRRPRVPRCALVQFADFAIILSTELSTDWYHLIKH